MSDHNNYPRRQFIKKTSLLTGAAIAGFNILGKANPASDNIVGHGNFRSCKGTYYLTAKIGMSGTLSIFYVAGRFLKR